MSEEFSFLHGLTREEEVFARNILDRVTAADKAGYCRYTMFLGERQSNIALAVMKSKRFERYCFFGGYSSEECECSRKMLAVFGEYAKPEHENFPIKAVSFRFKPCYRLTHRDFLGALMSLEIKRECIGDILAGEGACVAFLAEHIAEDALCIEKVGNVGVEAHEGVSALAEIDLSPKLKYIESTVSSLRADCIIAAAVGVSREKAQKILAAKNFVVAGKTVENSDFHIEEGMIFYIKGHGKYRLSQAGNVTRKNRVRIVIEKFV